MSKSKPLPINIRLFAEKGEGGQGNTDPDPNGGTNAQSGGNGLESVFLSSPREQLLFENELHNKNGL